MEINLKSHMAMLNNDECSAFYCPGWHVGSSGDNGEHLRDLSGWPYSVYRKAGAIGLTDNVLAYGIQDINDAHILAKILNARIGLASHGYAVGKWSITV